MKIIRSLLSAALLLCASATASFADVNSKFNYPWVSAVTLTNNISATDAARVRDNLNLREVLAFGTTDSVRNSVNAAGDGTYQALATYVMPANTMGPNDCLDIDVSWTYTNSANSKTLRMVFGGNNYISSTVTTTAGVRTIQTICNRNSTSSQVSGLSSTVLGGYGSTTNPIVTSSVDTTGAVTITIGGFWTAGAVLSENITLVRYNITLIRQ